jgi:putative ABC transport system permease protein
LISRIRIAAAKLRGLFGRRQADSEFDHEMREHLDLLTERYIRQGMYPHAAEMAARRQFGNTALLQEDHRRMRTIQAFEIFLRDLRYGARQLRLTPLFTAVAILSLALGIGANTALFELVNAVRLRSLPVARPQELGYIDFQKGSLRSGHFDSRSANFTSLLWQQIQTQQQSFSDLFAWSARRFNLATGGEVRWTEGLYTSGNFFRVLGVQPVLGRTFDAAEEAGTCASPGAVISYSFWQQEFGGASGVLGQNVTLNGRPFPIVGVTPPGFFGVEVGNRYDVAIPLCADRLMAQDGKGHAANTQAWWLSAMGRLKPGWTIERASASFQQLSPGMMQASLPSAYRADEAGTYLKNKLVVQPGAAGVSGLRSDYERPLWLLLGTAGLVLLIACVNLANLLLARAGARERDIAVRQAIGASRSRLVGQLMAECLLLSALGGALGAALAQGLSRGLVAFLSGADSGIFLGLAVDGRVLGFTAAISLGTCLFFGLMPALRATRIAPAAVMRSNGRGLTDGRERFNVRRVLVVLQVALSLVLLVGALLFVGSLRKLLAVDPGFRSDGIVAVDVDFRHAHYPKEQRREVYRQLMDRLRARPGVVAVAQVYLTPVSGSGMNETCWTDRNTGPHQVANFNRISPGYFKTMRTAMVAGRDFNDRDSLDAPLVAVVNQAFAQRFFAGRNPVGRTFMVESEAGQPDKRYEVVGLVRNTKYYEIREDFKPIAYVPIAQWSEPDATPTFLLRSSLPAGEVFRGVRAAVAEVNASMAVEFTVLSRQLQDSLLRDRLMAALAGAFGLLAGLLATLGLYGVVSYMVARRRNEIGIRIALGAGRSGIVWLVLREAALLLACGLAIGAGLALLAGQAAGSLLFGLKPNDPATLLAAMALLAAVAVAASCIPARRAARLDPMQAVRGE